MDYRLLYLGHADRLGDWNDHRRVAGMAAPKRLCFCGGRPSRLLLQITRSILSPSRRLSYLGYKLHWLPTGQPYDPGLMPNWRDWNFIKNVLLACDYAGFLDGIDMGSFIHTRYAFSDDLGTRRGLPVLRQREGIAPSHSAPRLCLQKRAATAGHFAGYCSGRNYQWRIDPGGDLRHPGIGGIFIRAMALHDFNVMQGVVLLSIVTVLTLGLIVDLLLPFLDPRIRRIND